MPDSINRHKRDTRPHRDYHHNTFRSRFFGGGLDVGELLLLVILPPHPKRRRIRQRRHLPYYRRLWHFLALLEFYLGYCS
uniref:Similarity. Hypothetical start n=1 Tax=Microcystis aeruginosa (strain PCC 7806) TaxID=267872 RepID=A8YGE9_MICA7|nr:unnamed protein product [Microcystis aeruginosa PCC 7806]